MSNFFITGASGFIGKKLLNALNSDLDSITIVSRNHQSEYKTIVCDLESEILPENSLKGIDVVIHLAGVAHDSLGSRDKYHDVNVKSTVFLAKMAINSGVKKFIFVSSVKANIDSLLRKNKDNFAKGSDGYYGKTKREAEIQLFEITKNSNLEVSIIRPSLVYGPSVKGNLALMLKGIRKGWFPPLPETNNKKSMVHVDDLVNAIILVINDHRAINQIFVVSDGIPYSSRQIYEILCKVCGKKIPNWYIPKSLFAMLTFLNRTLSNKVDKLLGTDYYPSSDRILKIGYSPKKTLKDINLSDY